MDIEEKAQELLDLVVKWQAGPHGKAYLKDELDLFLRDVIEEEREACAKICEDTVREVLDECGEAAGYDIPVRNCMMAIRIRSAKETNV